MNTIKPVLDTPEELKALLNRDVDNLLELRKGRGEEEAERLNAKANAVDSGLRALIRAVKANPVDADAAYREVIEKFAAEAEKVTDVGQGDVLHEARVKGRASGLEHVLYRMRGARV